MGQRNSSLKRNLWLTLSVWFLLLLGVCGMLLFETASAARRLTQLTTLIEPMVAATYEMEINTLGTGLGVLKYLDTGEPEFWDRVTEDSTEFAGSSADLRRLATDPQLVASAAEAESKFLAFTRVGRAMMTRRDAAGGPLAAGDDSGTAMMHRFRGLHASLDTLLDDRIQSVLAAHALRERDQAHQGARRLAAAVAAAVGAVMLLALVIGRGAAGRTVRRMENAVQELVEATKAAGEGQLHRRISGSLPAELGQVASAFNQMAASLETSVAELRTHQATLQDQVAQRTASLTASNAELRWLSEHLRYILESSPLAIVTVGLGGTVLSWNAAAHRVFGWAGAEVMGRPLPTIPREREAEFRTFLEGIGRSGSFTDVETRQVRNDGSLVDVSLSAAPICDSEGIVTGGILLYLDLTARKLLEEQFRQSQKMEAVGLLAGGIAHDYNNMLAAILGSAEILLSDLPADDPCRAEADQIRQVALRSAGLTRQLLAFGRRQVLQPRPLDLSQMIQVVQPMLQRLLGAGIAIEADLSDDLGLVEADPGQLEQVIVNLAVNARDAMPQGGRLTFRTRRAELDQPYASRHLARPAGSFVLLAVTDTGAGISPEVRERIFEPFFTTKELGQGSGLGLSTVYGIVKQSGGFIWVYSEPGLGTTFKIYLPRVAARSGAQAAQPSVALAAAGSEVILLVEDEEPVRRVTRQVLIRLGYRVLEAANAAQAIAVAGGEAVIDLVVTDVVMPHMNGPQMVQRLRAARPELRVLYVSGFSYHEAVDRSLFVSACDCLEKPFTADDLARKVRAVLEAHPTESDPASTAA